MMRPFSKLLSFEDAETIMLKTVRPVERKEEIFIGYESLVKKYGKDAVEDMPLGAVAMYCFTDKLRTGLQQIMAGSRNFRVDAINRSDVMALTEDAAKISGIPYVMDAYRAEAEQILDA